MHFPRVKFSLHVPFATLSGFLAFGVLVSDSNGQSILTWTGADGVGWSSSSGSDANWTDDPGGTATVTHFTNGDAVIFDSVTDVANASNRIITVNASGVNVNRMDVHGDGTYVLTGGRINATGDVFIDGTAVLQIGNGGSIGGLTVANVHVGSNAQLVFFSNDGELNIHDEVGIDQVIGDGTVVFKGVGISGESNYKINPNGSLFTGTVIVESGARLMLLDSSTSNADGIVVQNGGGLYILDESSSNNTYHNPIYIAGNGWQEGSGRLGALRFDNGSEATGPVILTADARIDALGATGTISGVISDGGGGYRLEKGGNGTIIFSNSNTYGGGTSIDGGTITITNAGALGVVGTVIDIADVGSLRINLAQDYNFNYVLTGSGLIEANLQANEIIFSNTGNAFSGTISLNNAIFDTGLASNATVISNAVLRLENGSIMMVSGNVLSSELILTGGIALTFETGGLFATQTLELDVVSGTITINFENFDTSQSAYMLITFQDLTSGFLAANSYFTAGTGSLNGYDFAWSGNSLVYTNIPEPSSYVTAIVILTALTTVSLRRRRIKPLHP